LTKKDPDFAEVLDNFDSISMIAEKKPVQLSTKLVVFSLLMFLGLVCYFIITIEDQNYELSRIKSAVARTLTARPI